ncbi:MAG TPA: DUF2807 domain-containing protein [Patescibacteria group bacterium]|nr:DUF2807 domain-containing protein [Patescibacteria group bacterium]
MNGFQRLGFIFVVNNNVYQFGTPLFQKAAEGIFQQDIMANFKKLRQMIEVQGSGNIATREFPVSSFMRLHLSTQGEVVLKQSDDEKVVIEADDNLLDIFEIVNSGRTLYVTYSNKLRKPVFTKLKITVYLRQIDTLYNASQGDLTTDGIISLTAPLAMKIQSHGNTKLAIKAPSMDVSSMSFGNVEISGECGEATINAKSHGNLNCRNLKAQDVMLRNMSHGSVEIWAENSVSIKHLGHGYVHYYGPGKLKDIQHYGHGEVRHMG